MAGILLAISHRTILRKKPDEFVFAAMWLSGSLLVAWLVLSTINGLTMGTALSDELFIGAFSAAVLGWALFVVVQILRTITKRGTKRG